MCAQVRRLEHRSGAIFGTAAMRADRQTCTGASGIDDASRAVKGPGDRLF
jgi:hypothetical protein